MSQKNDKNFLDRSDEDLSVRRNNLIYFFAVCTC